MNLNAAAGISGVAQNVVRRAHKLILAVMADTHEHIVGVGDHALGISGREEHFLDAEFMALIGEFRSLGRVL
ncbi:MAG: hypothetical protein L0G85_12895 [Kocuria sp.]|nr:hypothetical protein [Kocuria sp.]